jgi:ribosomal protein S8
MNKFNLALVICILNQSKFQKLSFCFVPYSILIFKFLKILKKNGFINGFNLNLKFFNKNCFFKTFIVYFKKTVNLINFNYSLISTRGKKIYLPFLFLQKLIKQNPSSTFFISSTKGLLDSTKVLKNKVGGELLFKII